MLLENSAALEALQADVKNVDAWKNLAASQTSPSARLQVLARAVATVPTSLSLRRAAVNELSLQNKQELENMLLTTLSLFPAELDLWNMLIHRFPSIRSFTMALRYAPNNEVWPLYSQFLLTGDISTEERVNGFQSFLEFDPSKQNEVLSQLIGAQLFEVAEQLGGGVELIEHSVNIEFLENLLEKHPEELGAIVPRLAELCPFEKARILVLNSLEISSVEAFPSLFRAAVCLYEKQIELAFAGASKTSEKAGSRLLAEFSNLLRKRPMLLSEAACREFPDNVAVWLAHADLWGSRPSLAADVLEKAIATVNPYLAVGDVSDLYIRYAEVAGGAHERLEDVISKPFMTSAMRAKIYTALANLTGNVEYLESALLLPAARPWLRYFEMAEQSKLLPAFNEACSTGELTMRMCLVVASAFPAGSADQIFVFEKGVELFPVPMVLPLWKQYVAAVSDIRVTRPIYRRALRAFFDHKRGYEELVLQYHAAEKTPHGSLLFSRQKLLHILDRSTNLEIWRAYIETLNDETGKRDAYERAINAVSLENVQPLAHEFCDFEKAEGQLVRAREISDFVSDLKTKNFTFVSEV